MFFKKAVSGILLALLLVSVFMLAFNAQPVNASGTIYIRADGSIDPPDAPIYTADNTTYTLTGNITTDASGVVIERDSIVVDGAGYTIQGTGAYPSKGIGLSGRSNVTIKSTKIKTVFYGMWLESSSNSSVIGNNMTNNNYYGIQLVYSSNNSIVGNSITASWRCGIGLNYSSNYNIVSGNSITNNDRGILLIFSSSNTISGNNITANSYYGIVLFDTSSNTINGNNITANPYSGIWLEGSSDNRFYHNNFGNSQQVHVYSSGYANVWDYGYPSGGNYWSDYSGNDTCSGPYQNETGSDNIGDTPYVIDIDNVDHYPLMIPCERPPPLTYSLNITATAGGVTDPPPGNYTYFLGQTVSVQAAPNLGYVLDHWELDIGNAGTDNPISIVMTADHTLYPVFSFVGICNLTITTTVGGTTNPTPGTYLYTNGTSAQVTAISDAYFILDHWELDGSNVGSASNCSVLMDSNHTLHPVFGPACTLTITTTVGGRTDPEPGIYSYAVGSNVQITAIPDVNNMLDHWELDGVKDTENPITVTMDQNRTLHAVFMIHDVSVTDVAVSKTVVGQGYDMSINVTVANQGDYTETFNVAAYFGNDTLTPEHAYEQWIEFWSMGDCNNDGYINNVDAQILANNLGWTGPPGTNPADLNSDGIVDTQDAMILDGNLDKQIWQIFLYAAGKQTISNLTGGDSATVMFVWNLTDVAYGNCTVTAVADPVAGETNTVDNNCTCGIAVHVGVPGDISGPTLGAYDGTCNMRDIQYLIIYFNTYPYSPNWKPNVDINNDGTVNMRDIMIAILHFNQHE